MVNPAYIYPDFLLQWVTNQQQQQQSYSKKYTHYLGIDPKNSCSLEVITKLFVYSTNSNVSMISNVMQAVIFTITVADIQPEQISKQWVANTQQMIIKFNLMYFQYVLQT